MTCHPNTDINVASALGEVLGITCGATTWQANSVRRRRPPLPPLPPPPLRGGAAAAAAAAGYSLATSTRTRSSPWSDAWGMTSRNGCISQFIQNTCTFVVTYQVRSNRVCDVSRLLFSRRTANWRKTGGDATAA